MAKPEISIFTSPKDLGNITREEQEIVIPFVSFNVPLTDTEGNTEINLQGKTRIIIVQGYHEGDGFDGATANQRLGDFIFEIEEWVNAGTQDTEQFTDSFEITYNVNCHDWSWVRSVSDPNRILWTLVMRQV